jgi:hypothetical protein
VDSQKLCHWPQCPYPSCCIGSKTGRLPYSMILAHLPAGLYLNHTIDSYHETWQWFQKLTTFEVETPNSWVGGPYWPFQAMSKLANCRVFMPFSHSHVRRKIPFTVPIDDIQAENLLICWALKVKWYIVTLSKPKLKHGGTTFGIQNVLRIPLSFRCLA